jgi:hypothetical protein
VLSDSCGSHAVSSQVVRADCRTDLAGANWFGLKHISKQRSSPLLNSLQHIYQFPLHPL